MKIFLKIIRTFFVVLGVIFFLIIIAGVYLYQTDVYGIKTLLNYENSSTEVNSDNDNDEQSANPALNTEQEEQLRDLGIDPAALPTEISPEMHECFVEKLGEERVREIEEGDSPTPLEVIKTEPCL